MAKRTIPAILARPGLQDRIMLARLWLGMSKADLARTTGVSNSAVTQWENGTTEPDIAHMLAWKQADDVPLDWIYDADTKRLPRSFEQFLVNYGARPDAPAIARRIRGEWVAPVEISRSGVAADEVAERILAHNPSPRRRGRPPKATLHEGRPKDEI
jgi:transcriptional regulator with XRE-family HTH domain